MKHLLLDANVLVRFFVQDDAKQGPAATALLEGAERGPNGGSIGCISTV